MKPDKQDPRKKHPPSGSVIPLVIVTLMLLTASLLGAWMYGLAGQIDEEIEQKMNSGVWDMPAQVYSRPWLLREGDRLERDRLVRILKSTRYHESTRLDSPGDFTQSGSEVLFYRREFTYPDHVSSAGRFRLHFAGSTLTSIEDMENGARSGTLEIEPRLVSMMYSPGDEQRIFRPLSSYPDSLIKMLVSTEDRSFWQHHGINVSAIARAFINNLRAGHTVQGGSTITQQVVKNLFLSRDKTYSRKIREILMALIMERKFSKSRILELYLNEVYLGQDGARGIYGFPLASTYYFGRQVNELTLAQQAMLIGMAKGASLYNPWVHPENARARRNQVLDAARFTGALSERDWHQATAGSLNVQRKGTVFIQHPAFMDRLKKEIRGNRGIELNALSGARIFSTFDPVAQEDAEQAVTATMPQMIKNSGTKDLQAALVVVQSSTGNILAIVGDKDVDYNGFNRATDASRQIGSLVKPFVYLSALKDPELYGLNTWLEDQPVKIDLGHGRFWSPRNYNRTYSGQVMLVDALAHSVNVATVNLGMAVGISTVAEVLKETGIPEKRVTRTPSMLLGTLDMAPLELAEGYQTIANAGRHTGVSALVAIEDRDGHLIHQRSPQAPQAVPVEAAWLTLFAMQQSVKAGTSRRLGAGLQQYALAGKTGTSSNNRDSWFTGIDGDKVVLAWAGRDNNQPTRLWGANGSLLITRAFFGLNGITALKPARPGDIFSVSVGANGSAICDSSAPDGTGVSSSRTLPVWGRNYSQVCQGSEQFRPVSANKPYTSESIDGLF